MLSENHMSITIDSTSWYNRSIHSDAFITYEFVQLDKF